MRLDPKNEKRFAETVNSAVDAIVAGANAEVTLSELTRQTRWAGKLQAVARCTIWNNFLRAHNSLR